MIFGGLEMPNYSINALCWRFRALRGPKITIPTPSWTHRSPYQMPCAGIWYVSNDIHLDS